MRWRWLVLVAVLAGAVGCGWSPLGPRTGAVTYAAADHFADEPELRLAKAIVARDEPEISAALAAGADPDAVGTGRMTMLQFAVRNDRDAGVRLLLDASADPERIGYRGSTAVHDAAAMANSRLIELTLAAGADVNLRSELRTTPLYDSIVLHEEERVRFLLQQGADPTLTNRLGELPTHYAGRVNAGAELLLLLEAGSDPRAKNQGGATFQDYYFGYDKALLNDRGRAERQQVADWLRAHDVPVDPRA